MPMHLAIRQKPPLRGPARVFAHFARQTHRICSGNSRTVDFEDAHVGIRCQKLTRSGHRLRMHCEGTEDSGTIPSIGRVPGQCRPMAGGSFRRAALAAARQVSRSAFHQPSRSHPLSAGIVRAQSPAASLACNRSSVSEPQCRRPVTVEPGMSCRKHRVDRDLLEKPGDRPVRGYGVVLRAGLPYSAPPDFLAFS